MTGVGTAIVDGDPDELKAKVADAKKQKRWVQEIKFYETKASSWETKGKKILRRYKDDRSPREQKAPRFNILWSITESAKPALFSNNPKPDIERRFRDKDATGRYASMVLERSITFFIDQKFKDAMDQAVIDRLLPGRGTIWVRYEPHFKDAEVNENEEVADEGLEITDNVESYSAAERSAKRDGYDDAGSSDPNAIQEPAEILDDEAVCYDYVHWQDFGHSFGRTWDEVPAAWRKVYLTKAELIARFGKEIGEKISLDYSPEDLKENREQEIEKKATVYEIWDKAEKKAIWIHKDYLPGPLDEKDDPLELKDFWPFPKPLFATLANDTCIPVPDYTEYQDQAAELDELTSRIGAITRAVKIAGVYDASAPGIERILAEGVENQLVPVQGWAALSEKGGIQGSYALLPMDQILKTLLGLYEARDKVKADLYEISGSADVMRGQSDPDETAEAQNIKAQFGTMRLNDKQDQVKRFARDLVKIGTEIIAKHFSIDTIKKICGIELFTEQDKQTVKTRMQMLAQFQQQQEAFKQQQTAAQQPQAAPPQGVPPGAPPQQPGMQSGNLPAVMPSAPPQAPQLPPLPDYIQKMDQEDLQEAMENPSWEDVEKLLRDNTTLAYKIDIETDSTIKFDQNAERDARVQFLDATGKFLTSAMQNQNPDLEPLLAKLLEFGVRGFRVGKELESAFDTAIHKLEKSAADPTKQRPNAEVEKIKSDQAMETQKMQNNMTLEKQKSDDEKARLQLQAQVDQHQGEVDAGVNKFKIEQQGKVDLEKARLESETKIIVAKIGAGAKAVAEGGMDATIPPTGDLVGTMGPSLNDLMHTVIAQLQQTFQGIQQSNQNVIQSHQQLAQAMMRPRQVVRDEQGNISAVH